MTLLLSILISFSATAKAECIHLSDDFARLSQIIKDNNANQSNNLEYVGNYMLNLHGSLQNWEGRKVAVPKGQFNFLKQDGEMIKDVADSSFTIGKDIAKNLDALHKRLTKCITK